MNIIALQTHTIGLSFAHWREVMGLLPSRNTASNDTMVTIVDFQEKHTFFGLL